jgi:hypothetical protein
MASTTCKKCPGDECSGLCSLFEEFDEDAFSGVAFETPRCCTSSLEIDRSLCEIFQSNGINQVNVKIEKHDPDQRSKEEQVEDSREGEMPVVTPDDEEPRSERKRKNEKDRRNQVNEGFDELVKLIFHIQPQLKIAAQARAVGISNKTSSRDVTELLGRVELVNAAVATLTRIHQENEFHKNAISKYATREPTSVALAPSFEPLPSLLDLSSAENNSNWEIDEKESQAVRKRKREKLRRESINNGLDQLMNLIFVIDPEIKVAAEEKARLERAVGRRNNYLLSRVELMKIAVATMARFHQDNEVHRSILSHLSASHDQVTSASTVASVCDTAQQALVDFDGAVHSGNFDMKCTAHTFYPPSPSDAMGLMAPTTGSIYLQQLPLVGEQQVDEQAFVSFLGETEFADDKEPEDGEPSTKRLKEAF